MPIPSSPLQDAIDRLTKREPGWEKFRPPPTKGGRPGTVSNGRPSGSGTTADAVVLEELDAAQREYYGTRMITSSDGLFTVEVKPIKKIVLKDGGNILLQDPPA